MITYKLSKDLQFAQQFVDGIATGIWANVETNQEYLKWLAEGNEPLQPDNNQ